jgi:hypothetical protein
MIQNRQVPITLAPASDEEEGFVHLNKATLRANIINSSIVLVFQVICIEEVFYQLHLWQVFEGGE